MCVCVCVKERDRARGERERERESGRERGKYFKKGKRKVQGVQQLQAAALPRHQEEEETDKTKQAQI